MIIMYLKSCQLQFQEFLYIKMSETAVKIVTVCDKTWRNLILISFFPLIIEFNAEKFVFITRWGPYAF